MANSLFDQLQKSGLIDKKKARKTKQNQYKSKKQKTKKGTSGEVDEAKLLVQKAHDDKVERDRQLNQQRKEEADRNAIKAQIRQLIESNCIKDRDGDIVYNFTDANVVKRIYVSDHVHKNLSSGRLAIARLEERYELVPAPVAEKIKQRDELCIIITEKIETQDEDDAYTDYKIPDDLMW